MLARSLSLEVSSRSWRMTSSWRANSCLGKADTLEETPFQTARREAFEEIGLPFEDHEIPAPFQIEHLCELPVNLAVTALGVRPCVAMLHNKAPTGEEGSNTVESLKSRLDAKEVEAIFTAPLRSFLEKQPVDAHGKAQKDWYRGVWSSWNDMRWRMHNFYVRRKSPSQGGDKIQTFRVWGLTARMLLDAARVAYGKDPDFEHNASIGDEDLVRKSFEAGQLGPVRSAKSRINRETMTADQKPWKI